MRKSIEKGWLVLAVAVVAVLCFGSTASAQYGTYGGYSYPTYYYPSYYYPSYYQPYYKPAYEAPKYTCPTPEPKADATDVVDKLIKEAKLRKAISELPKDQQEIMLKRLGWWKEKEPGTVPPLSDAEIELLKGLLQKK